MNPIYAVISTFTSSFILFLLLFLLRAWVFLKPRERSFWQLFWLPLVLLLLSVYVFLHNPAIIGMEVCSVAFSFVLLATVNYCIVRRQHMPVDAQTKKMSLPSSALSFALLLVFCLTLFAADYRYLWAGDSLSPHNIWLSVSVVLFALTGYFAGAFLAYCSSFRRQKQPVSS